MNLDPDTLDRALLDRYLTGECRAGEVERVRAWLAAAPANVARLQELRDVREVMTSRTTWDVAAMWARTTDAIAHAEPNGTFGASLSVSGTIAPMAERVVRSAPLTMLPGSGRRAGWSVVRLAVAAAVLVIVGGALVTNWYDRNMREASAIGRTEGTFKEYVTQRGQRTTFGLPDGSHVVLGPASRLRYPASLGEGKGRRDVYLEGHALFEVKHDDQRAFLVRTADGVTEDLGTHFTVRQYAGDSVVQVAVAEGSVGLRPRGQRQAGVILRAGQAARLTRAGNAIVRSNVDVARELAWTEGRVVFDRTPLRDMLHELGFWYDVEFVLDASVSERPVTTTVAGEDLSQTLDLLSAAFDLTYQRVGRRITLAPRQATR